MPRDIKENEEVWTTLESKTRLITIFTKPEDAMFPRTSSSMTGDHLRVEDLDVHRTPLHKPNRTTLSVERRQCSGTTENAISSEHFTVYQGGDLNKFFGCDVFAPKRVSEVCLVNDHYILVKIPESQSEQSEMEYKQNPRLSTSKSSKEVQSGKKFTKYLHCNNCRSSRVSPIPETVNTDTAPKTSWSSNDCVQEVFKSRTIIKGKLDVFQHASSTKRPKQDSCHAADTNKSTEFPKYSRQTAEAFRKPLKTSLSDQVELEVHGRLETPPSDLTTTRKCNRKQSLPRPRRPFGLSFRCFLKSFRNRYAKKSTTATNNKKIHVVVYKTFFVSWTKAKQSSYTNSLRRTRSAVF